MENAAKVITGDAKAIRDVVTGKHGGIENVLVDFEDKALERLAIGDKILIRGYGLGLSFIKYPHIKPINLSPSLAKALPIREDKTKGILPYSRDSYYSSGDYGFRSWVSTLLSRDYDIQLFDKQSVEKYYLKTLRFGDIVAIMDADHTYGRIYRTGAVSIGVIVHSNCVTAGHGPGVTTLLTSVEGKIAPYIDSTANIGVYLDIGRFRKNRERNVKVCIKIYLTFQPGLI